ncbi:MAG TPA: OmpA family protein [Bacteroides sp.]|nr:OmpA family protein [Bacteroides sp.]
MKRSSLFFVLLAGWIIVASWWYVCKIRDDCRGSDILSGAQAVESPAAEAAALVAAVEPAEDSVTLALDYIRKTGERTYYFDFASAEFHPGTDEDRYMSALRIYFSARPDAVLTVEGHSDSRGSAAANDKFARLRAEAAGAHFTRNGIETSRMRIVSKSDTEPAASNETEKGRSSNRRVEVTVN